MLAIMSKIFIVFKYYLVFYTNREAHKLDESNMPYLVFLLVNKTVFCENV